MIEGNMSTQISSEQYINVTNNCGCLLPAGTIFAIIQLNKNKNILHWIMLLNILQLPCPWPGQKHTKIGIQYFFMLWFQVTMSSHEYVDENSGVNMHGIHIYIYIYLYIYIHIDERLHTGYQLTFTYQPLGIEIIIYFVIQLNLINLPCCK